MHEQPTWLSGRAEESDRWCALHTRHQHEKSVATILVIKGFQVFLPTYEATRRWTDRTKQISLALFPGYLFIADESDHRLQILSTPGVHAIVKAGNLPAVIPNDEIKAIRRWKAPSRSSHIPFFRRESSSGFDPDRLPDSKESSLERRTLFDWFFR